MSSTILFVLAVVRAGVFGRRASTLLGGSGRSVANPQLRAMFGKTETPLRGSSDHLPYSKLERRKRHEAALARCEFILSQGRRYRDVLKQTQAMEIEPEPIKKPKIKSPRKR